MRGVAALAWALCACGDGAPAPAPRQDPPARFAEPQQLPQHDSDRSCVEPEREAEDIWRDLEKKVEILDEPDAGEAASALSRLLWDLDARGDRLHAEVTEVDEARLAVFTQYRCGQQSSGGRLLLLRRTQPAGWRIVDRMVFPPGELAAVVARAGGSFVLTSSMSSTQHSTSQLWLVHALDDRWQQRFFDRALVDLEVEVSASGADVVARWSRWPTPLARSVAGPKPRYEIVLPLDARVAVGRVRSTTPWLVAADEYCRTRRCGDVAMTATSYAGELATVRLEGPGARRDCDGEAIGSSIVSDLAVVLDLERSDGAWSVIGSRPADRGCAATRTTGTNRRRFARGTEVLARTAPGSALAPDENGLVWTRDEVLVTWRPGTRPGHQELRDRAQALARDGGSTVWISSETRDVRRIRGDGAPETLTRAELDAVGVASVDGVVYWTCYASGKLWQLRGGARTVLTSGLAMPMGLAVVGDALLVSTATGIVRVDRRDGTVTATSLPASAPLWLAARGDTTAWTDAAGRVVVSGPRGRAHVIAYGGRPTQIALQDRYVVWLDSADGRVRRARLPDESRRSTP